MIDVFVNVLSLDKAYVASPIPLLELESRILKPLIGNFCCFLCLSDLGMHCVWDLKLKKLCEVLSNKWS